MPCALTQRPMDRDSRLRSELSAELMARLDGLETGEPSYWSAEGVESLDGFNVFLDKERLRRELG